MLMLLPCWNCTTAQLVRRWSAVSIGLHVRLEFCVLNIYCFCTSSHVINFLLKENFKLSILLWKFNTLFSITTFILNTSVFHRNYKHEWIYYKYKVKLVRQHSIKYNFQLSSIRLSWIICCHWTLWWLPFTWIISIEYCKLHPHRVKLYWIGFVESGLVLVKAFM